MNIVGEKVVLRAIELEDKNVLLSLINDADSEYALGGWSFPVSKLTQENWIKSLSNNEKILRCMIVDKNTSETIGTVILSDIDFKNGNAELHIKLISETRGKGYGKDTVKTIVKYAFEELRLKSIYAQINEYNISSQKLFEKCLFEKDGILRKRIFKKGEFHDVYIYSILNEV